MNCYDGFMVCAVIDSILNFFFSSDLVVITVFNYLNVYLFKKLFYKLNQIGLKIILETLCSLGKEFWQRMKTDVGVLTE